jgi:hypothetical protein
MFTEVRSATDTVVMRDSLSYDGWERVLTATYMKNGSLFDADIQFRPRR